MFVVISVEVNNTHIREKPTQRLDRCFTEFIFSRIGSVTITRDSAMLTKKVTLGLSDVDKPYDFLKALNSFKPFGFDDLKAKIYFEKYHDRESQMRKSDWHFRTG